MDHKDRIEIRELLNDVLCAHTEKVNGKFEVIKTQLTAIQTQTEKTNGRVTKLEDETKKLKNADLMHVIQCPNSKKIAELEGSSIGRKAVWKFAGKIGGIAGVIVGLVIAFFELIIKL